MSQISFNISELIIIVRRIRVKTHVVMATISKVSNIATGFKTIQLGKSFETKLVILKQIFSD